MAEENEETPQVDRPEAGPPDQNAGPDAPRSNPSEEVEAAATPEAEAPEAEAPETTEAEAPAEEAPAAEEAPKPKAAPKSGATRREKLEAKRAERRTAAGK